MDDWEDELMGSHTSVNQMVLCRHNFWVVKKLLVHLTLHLTGSENDPPTPSSNPFITPMDIEQPPPPPQRAMPITMHGKAAINVAAEYRKTEPLPVKWSPSNSEEDISNEEETSSDVKSPKKYDGHAFVNPLYSSATGLPNSQLGFSFGVPIEEDPPSKPQSKFHGSCAFFFLTGPFWS